MLNGSEEKRPRSCWIKRTELEKGLIGIVLIASLLIATLLVVILLYTTTTTEVLECRKTSREGGDSAATPCDSSTCIKEALEILNRIDTNIDPCEDFYAFACNNTSKYTVEDNYYGLFTPIVEAEAEKLHELYSEPIRSDDHQVIKVQKKMYSACRNETAIAENSFSTIKDVLRTVGGWPVVKGSEWNESSFDWVQTTYKLRQLGYIYSSFLELNIVPDPKNREKYIFQVSIPDVQDFYSRWFDSDERPDFMTDVAVVFGAQAQDMLAQMYDTYHFLQSMQSLQRQRKELMNEINFQRYKVVEFQNKENTINWLEFINTIAGPNARVSKNDVVLFPQESYLDEWFGLLNRTQQKTKANYMMWRVVEEALPYLTEELRKSGVKPRFMGGGSDETETRSQFCMNEIRKRFSPNPMDIMYMRRYLPEKKKQAVEELVNNMNKELLKVVKESEWMDKKDKQKALDRIKGVVVVIGAPGNYFDDGLFKKMKLDLNKTNNFLSMLSQANRDNLDRLYGLFNSSTSDTKIVWKDFISNYLKYDAMENELNIPASMLQGPIFNDKRPNYLNYANMGIVLKYFFFNILGTDYDWSKRSEEAFDRKRDCLIQGTNSEKTPIPGHVIDGLIAHVLGTQVSYAAYKNWTKGNEESEESLTAINYYKPEQLFWMSSGYVFCEYTHYTGHLDPKTAEAYSSMVSKVINVNPILAKDFDCPAKSFKNNCVIF